MKSTGSDQELADAGHAIQLLGGRVRQIRDYPVPGTQVTHRLIAIQKVAPTLKGYPKRWGQDPERADLIRHFCRYLIENADFSKTFSGNG